MKISIIGAGNVGGLTAARLCNLEIDEIVLVDAVTNLANAKSLDLSDARFIFEQNCLIHGTEDINQIANSNIVIITAGLARKPGMSREELVQKNGAIIKDICKHIKVLCPDSIIIVVTNPLDAMTYLVVKETGLPSNRILGMGLTLDSSRLANIISQELNIGITEIHPCIIGSHGQTMLPLARHTKVKGQLLDNYSDKEKINSIFKRTINRGAEIVSLLGSGSAYFAPSAAIFELVKAIVNDEKSNLSVSVHLNGEYGLKDICIGVPCCIGKNGIEKIVELELNNEERESLIKSADSIKKQLSSINLQTINKS